MCNEGSKWRVSRRNMVMTMSQNELERLHRYREQREVKGQGQLTFSFKVSIRKE